MSTAAISRTRHLIGHHGGLITIDGMAEAWGMSRQGAKKVTQHYRFPDPLPVDIGRDVDRERKVWLYAEVDLFRPLSS